jgi:hypothetical protein
MEEIQHNWLALYGESDLKFLWEFGKEIVNSEIELFLIKLFILKGVLFKIENDKLIIETNVQTAHLIIRHKINLNEMRVYNLITKKVSYFFYDTKEIIAKLQWKC